MTATILTIIVGCLVALICLWDAYRWNRSGQTLFKFFLLNGELKLPGFVSAIVAANLSLGNFIVFVATWGYKFGIAGILFFIANLVLNFIGVIIYLKSFKPYIESKNNHGTIHDYLSRQYGGDPRTKEAIRIRLSASLVTIVCLSLAMMFELSLAVQLLQPRNSIEAIYMFGALAGLVGVFTAYGGFKTLIASDFANASILGLSLLALVYFIYYFSKKANLPIFDHISIRPIDIHNLGIPSILSIIVIGFGWMLVAMDQWQRSCASESYNITRWGTLGYLLILSIFACAFATWGAFDHSILPHLLPDGGASLSGATNPLLDIARLPASGWLQHAAVMLIVSALVLAAVSTTNTFLNVCSHSLTTDVLVGGLSQKEMNELSPAQNRFFVGVARAIIVLLAALLVVVFGIATALGLLKDPLSFFYITYSVQFALLAPMMLSGLSEKTRPSSRSALLSICVGFLTALVMGATTWWLSQGDTGVFLTFNAGDWLTLTPAVTVGAGFLTLLLTPVLAPFIGGLFDLVRIGARVK